MQIWMMTIWSVAVKDIKSENVDEQNNNDDQIDICERASYEKRSADKEESEFKAAEGVIGSSGVWSKCKAKDIPPKRGSARQLAAALKHGKKPPTKLSCLDNMEYEVVIHVKWKSDDKAVSVADLEESEGTSGTKRGSARLLAAALKVQ